MKFGMAAALVWITLLAWLTPGSVWAQGSSRQVTLADFSAFPKGWKISSDTIEISEIYQTVRGKTQHTLLATGKDKPYRIFKKTSWDAKAYPILQWKWRVTKWPQDPNAQVYFYVSLDKDLFGIPTMIKYVWSQTLKAGTLKEGGFFRPAEVVLQGGTTDSGQWVIQEINALKDFQTIIGRDPREEAYGIGMLVDPGVEAEFGEIYAKEKE